MRLDMTRLVHLRGVDLEPAVGRFVIRPAHKGRATHVCDFSHRLTRRQAVRDFHQGTLGVAVQHQIALGIDHDRAPHLVRPVVVVRNAAQRALDAAQHNGHVLESFTAALAVDDGGTVRPPASHVAGRVGVVAADLAVRRVAVDHRIHVACRHAPEQVRLAQHLERLGALPVRLRNDADAKALRFEHASDHRHAKARVIDIGVTRHQNNVAAVPAEHVHLGAAHRQEFGRAEASRPVSAVAGQRFGGARKEGNVDKGSHAAKR